MDEAGGGVTETVGVIEVDVDEVGASVVEVLPVADEPDGVDVVDVVDAVWSGPVREVIAIATTTSARTSARPAATTRRRDGHLRGWAREGIGPTQPHRRGRSGAARDQPVKPGRPLTGTAGGADGPTGSLVVVLDRGVVVVVVVVEGGAGANDTGTVAWRSG